MCGIRTGSMHTFITALPALPLTFHFSFSHHSTTPQRKTNPLYTIPQSNHPGIPSSSIQPRNRRLLPLRRAPSQPPTPKHTPQHIHHRIPLPRHLNPKVHLPNRIQRLPPIHILQIRRIMALQLAEQTRVAALHRQEQQSQKIQQGERRVYPQVGRRGGDFLHGEGGLRGEPRGEEEEEFIGGPQVAGEEVGEGAPGGVERRGVRVVGGVEGVFEGGEGFGGGLRAEDEVAFCVVGLEVCVRTRC